MPSSGRSQLEYSTDVVGARVAAQVIDLVVSGVLFLLSVAAVRSLGVLAPRTAFLLSTPVFIAYGAVLEGFWNGQTLGKRTLGIQVRTVDGSEVRPIQALLRNLPAALIPGTLVYLVALLSIASTEHRQRVFDQVADTIVVRHY